MHLRFALSSKSNAEPDSAEKNLINKLESQEKRQVDEKEYHKLIRENSQIYENLSLINSLCHSSDSDSDELLPSF